MIKFHQRVVLLMSLTQYETAAAGATGGVAGTDVRASLNTAVAQDEANLFTTLTGCTQVDIALGQLAAPAAPVITQIGTVGTTNFSYVVADVGNVGLAPSSATQTTTGNAILSSGNANVITWTGVPGHTYNVYRSASSGTPSGLGLLGTVNAAFAAAGASSAAAVSLTFTDTGQNALSTSVPTANSTGSASVPGFVCVAGTVLLGANVQTISSTATTGVLTPTNILNQILLVTGGATPTFTMPLPSVLVAAIKGITVNTGFKFSLRNSNSGSATLAVTTGVTSAAGNTLALISLNTREYLIQFTNVTSGSEAYTFWTNPASAY